MKTFWAISVNSQKVAWLSPKRSSVFNVFAPVMFACRTVWNSGPYMAPKFINRIFLNFVALPFKGALSNSKTGVFSILLFTPFVLIFGIFANVIHRSNLKVGARAFSAFMRNCLPFFVVLGSSLAYGANGTNFKLEFFGAGHNTDIIATQGDIKQGENGETPDRTIPCQAAAIKRVAEGVTTRGRAISGNAPTSALPSKLFRGDEIVCSAWEHAGARDKEPGTKTIRTTIQSRSGELADNVTANNPLLQRLKQKGNIRPFSGGNVILEEIMYNDTSTNNTNSYSGYEVLNIAPNSPISAAQFAITQYASAVTISGLEMLQNSGKEQIIDLIEGRVRVAEAQLMNRIDADLYGDGTGNGGKNITGLAAAVPDSPTSGTYGGIDRATWSFWQSVAYGGVTNGGAAVSASNINQYMTNLAIQLVRGTNKSDLIVADNNYYSLFVQSMQAIQRVTSSTDAVGGFASLKFAGGGMAADVVLGGGVGSHATANHMFFLNTNYINFRPHKDRNFVPIGGERQSVNQDAVVKLIGWAGNLTTSNSQLQGVLIA